MKYEKRLLVLILFSLFLILPLINAQSTDSVKTIETSPNQITIVTQLPINPTEPITPAKPPSNITSSSSAPIPKDAHCFDITSPIRPECVYFYDGTGRQKCPRYFNPVYNDDGTFYPTACWAEFYGITNYKYGYSPKLLSFFKERWALEGLDVSHPNIEFAYQDNIGNIGTKLRSVFWHNTSYYSVLDYDISEAYTGNPVNTFREKYTLSTLIPVINEHPKTLQVYVVFDDAYPEDVLLSLTKTHVELLNDYIRKKQEVPNPIQYAFTPVVISPPAGVKRITSGHIVFDNTEVQAIYNVATQKSGISDAKVLSISPVIIGGFGGYFTLWNDLEVIVSPLNPPAAYSTTDKKAGLDALAAFQEMFITISHEVLHAVGLSGDHMPMGYGTTFLDWVGALETNPVTGKRRTSTQTRCDFLGTSPDYYAVELPPHLKILIGQEPSWLYKEKSSSGDCLDGLYQNDILKDFDKDGEYEIMYKNNLIGKELQRSLGWTDVDGDGVAELVDPTPYGRGGVTRPVPTISKPSPHSGPAGTTVTIIPIEPIAVCPVNCMCEDDTVTCPITETKPIEAKITSIELEIKPVSIEKKQGKLFIITEKAEAVTEEKLVVEENKLLIETPTGNIEVRILPEEASSKATEIEIVTSIELKEEDSELIYSIKGEKEAKIIAIFPISIEIETKISAETGNVISVNKPWWNLLAW